MWLFASGRYDIPIYLFEYHPTRAATVVRSFLSGWEGTIHADGYRAYYNLGDGITVIGCLAHVRRKFCDIVKSVGEEQAKGTTAYTAVSKLDEIFAIERDLAELSPEQRMAERSDLLAAKLDDFHRWLLDVHSAAVPKMALAKAVDYALEQWPYIMHVLDDGRFEITNNRAERGIRPFAVGRKNWLFSDSPRGAHASAIIYSVIRTAMANGLKPYAYLEWLFSEMPGHDLTLEGAVSRFMPWSADVPDSCRMEAEETTKTVEGQCEAIVDIDPHYLDDQDSD